MMQTPPPHVGPCSLVYAPDLPRWHAVMVKPQKEAAAQAWLDRCGVYSFYPVTTRTIMVRHKRKQIVSRYLPGYLFARFPGIPIVHKVMARDLLIRDFMRLRDGRIGILAPDDLEALHAMRAMDEEAKERIRQAALIRTGDKVRILSGILDGLDSEVVEIRGATAVVRLTMFGGERTADVDIAKLGKV